MVLVPNRMVGRFRDTVYTFTLRVAERDKGTRVCSCLDFGPRESEPELWFGGRYFIGKMTQENLVRRWGEGDRKETLMSGCTTEASGGHGRSISPLDRET